MIFSDWEKHKNAKLSTHLLWEYDLTEMDWYDMRLVVVQRVIERGWLDDFYAAIRLYGGIEPFKEIIKQIPVLSPKDMQFVCTVFNLQKSELRCYTRPQLRAKLMNS